MEKKQFYPLRIYKNNKKIVSLNNISLSYNYPASVNKIKYQSEKSKIQTTFFINNNKTFMD